MKYRIRHQTHYQYQQAVSGCHSLAHLQPRQLERQRLLNHLITVLPEPANVDRRQDYFGNQTFFFEVQSPHEQLRVTSLSEVEVVDQNKTEFPIAAWDAVLNQPLPLEARFFQLDSALASGVDGIREYAQDSFTKGRPLIEIGLEINERIFNEFVYDPRFTTVSTPLTTVLEHKRGVCQDFAHLAIAVFRSFGLAARYVSGYIETLPPPGESKLTGSDASHAWFSLYLPDFGWVDFDPTNNCMTHQQHVTLAWGRDYQDVAPVKGVVVGGREQSVSVSVDMERIA